MALCFFGLAAFFGGITAGATGTLSVWQAFPLTLVGHYVSFSVLHDAAHRSVSAKFPRLNELLGNLSAIVVSPALTLPVFRYLHLLHHKNTNMGEDLDPDHWLALGPAWTRPLRLLTGHFNYSAFYLRRRASRPRSEVLQCIAGGSLYFGMILTAILTGHGQEFFGLYLAPSTLSIGFLGLTFAYLPHHPHEVSRQDDPYRSTSVRTGNEWLLTPMLLGHNFHLIHHLYPSAPFYRYPGVWRVMEAELRRRGALVLE